MVRATCPLGAYGYNRDGKKGKKQVVLGVICNEAGCPIWLDVFKGDTADQTTVKQELLALKDKLGVERFTFVCDRGMVTHARIEELEQEGWWEQFNYITALTRQEMMGLVDDEDHPIQLTLFDHRHLGEVEHKGTRYVLCHNPEREARDRETRLRLVALTEAKLERLRANVEAGRVKNRDVIARRLYRWLNRWAWNASSRWTTAKAGSPSPGAKTSLSATPAWTGVTSFAPTPPRTSKAPKTCASATRTANTSNKPSAR
ncbi:MAG: transposase [Candidatus Hydrogenedentota bacterium]